MAKAVKLADIAERLHVSVVTVSKALSDQKGVSEELREKIKRLASEMGYVQPSQAKKLKEAKSYNIGVLIEESYLDRYSSFYWQLYQQVAAFTMERGSFTILEIVTENAEDGLELPMLLEEQKVDGLVIIGKLGSDYLDMLMKGTEIPMVYMDFSDGHQNADAVVSDNFYGSYYLTNYLISMGHTRIAYVGTIRATGSIMDRYLGYCRAMLEHGLEIRRDWVIDDRAQENGFIDENKYLKLPSDMPSAFFCNCDLTAGKLIHKLQKKGYRVPEDISVAGYDNYIYPGLCNVEITTYEVDLKAMAKRVVETIFNKLNKESYSHGVHIVEGRVVIKNSVKNLNEDA